MSEVKVWVFDLNAIYGEGPKNRKVPMDYPNLHPVVSKNDYDLIASKLSAIKLENENLKEKNASLWVENSAFSNRIDQLISELDNCKVERDDLIEELNDAICACYEHGVILHSAKKLIKRIQGST